MRRSLLSPTLMSRSPGVRHQDNKSTARTIQGQDNTGRCDMPSNFASSFICYHHVRVSTPLSELWELLFNHDPAQTQPGPHKHGIDCEVNQQGQTSRSSFYHGPRQG